MFTKICNKHMMTKEYLEFMENKCFSTYIFLRGSIIKESDYVLNSEPLKPDTYRLYHTYYKNNKLVTHYTMSTMGKYFNKTKSAISKRIKELEVRGFIKIYKYISRLDGITYDYELGWYDGEYGCADYKEYYYMDNYFDKVCENYTDDYFDKVYED